MKESYDATHMKKIRQAIVRPIAGTKVQRTYVEKMLWSIGKCSNA